MTRFTSKEAFENWIFKNADKQGVKLAEEAWNEGFNYALELLNEPKPKTLNAITLKDCLNIFDEALRLHELTPGLSQELILHAFSAGKRLNSK